MTSHDSASSTVELSDGVRSAPRPSRIQAARGLRRLSNPVFWITVAWAGMLGFFLVAVPVYQAPDENAHVDRILSTPIVGFPDYDELRYRPETAASMALVGLIPRPEPYWESEAPSRPLPTFAELSGGPPTGAVNQLAGHPPAYYALMGGLRTGLTALLPRNWWQFDLDVMLLRGLNVLLLLGLPWIIARTALTLGLGRWAAWVAAAVPLCIPQMAHIGAAVNNDNLLVLASALATMFAADVIVRGLRWSSTLAMALATGVAVQTKILGWAMVPLAIVVCLVALRTRARSWPRALVAAMIVAASGWTYVRNLVVHGHPYPTLAPAGQPVAPEGFAFDAVAFLTHWVGNTVQSFVGRFGWLWLPLPLIWVVAVAGVLIVCVAHAMWRPARPGVRMLLIPVGVIGALYLYTSYEVHMSTGAYAAQQGRYLFPVIVSLAVAVASAAGAIGRRAAAAGVASIAAIGWVLSAQTVMAGFWAGSGSDRLGSLAAWSPLGSLSAAVLAVAVAAFWGGLGLALRSASRRGAEPGDATPDRADRDVPGTARTRS